LTATANIAIAQTETAAPTNTLAPTQTETPEPTATFTATPSPTVTVTPTPVPPATIEDLLNEAAQYCEIKIVEDISLFSEYPKTATGIAPSTWLLYEILGRKILISDYETGHYNIYNVYVGGKIGPGGNPCKVADWSDVEYERDVPLDQRTGVTRWGYYGPSAPNAGDNGVVMYIIYPTPSP